MIDFDSSLREYALRVIADDYESFEYILENVIELAAEHGGVADREGTLKALETLIRDGFAQAYLLGREAEPVSYDRDQLDDLWFYLTPKGIDLIRQFQKNWA